MWKQDEIIHLLAGAYHSAALSNCDMSIATKTLETIRSVLLRKEDVFEALDTIDDQIGRAAADTLQRVLVEMRDRFEQQIQVNEIARLHEVFRRDPQTGWRDWLRTYSEALSLWRVRFCSALSEANFLFPPHCELKVEEIKRSTKCILHERWPEVYDFVIYLAEQDFIPIVLDV